MEGTGSAGAVRQLAKEVGFVPRKQTGFEALLEERDLLRKQVDWLCERIPSIGTLVEPSDGRPVESSLDMDEFICPNFELYKTCKNRHNPNQEEADRICSECWKRESLKAVSSAKTL